MRWTGRPQGHLGRPDAVSSDTEIQSRRRAINPLPWSWLRQVHGAEVVTVGEPGQHAGTEADALVTGCPDAVLAVFTADCAPVAFVSEEGIIGLAHAGWRGVVLGVIGRTVEVMRAMGATQVLAALGPCIRAGCYEFGKADLDVVVGQLGDGVRKTTTWGSPALDLAEAVRQSVASAGAELVLDAGACTACSSAWFSFRANRDSARQATVVWRPGS